MKNTKEARRWMIKSGAWKLLDDVDDGFNYFNDFRLEELKDDDIHYIKAFMDYIFHLECKVDSQAKIIRNK